MDPQADVKNPHADTIDLERLDLREVLDFRPDQGITRMRRAGVTLWRRFVSTFTARISDKKLSACGKLCIGASKNSIAANDTWRNASAS